MLRRARTAAAARAAAALIVVALSGVPRVASLHAPVKGHVCTCGTHAGKAHQCSCVLCRRAALSALASAKHLPRCHRDAAREQLAADESRVPGSPCLDGTCGDGAQAPLTAAGVEPFCLPLQPVLALVLAEEMRRPGSGSAPTRAFEPETPPPRSA